MPFLLPDQQRQSTEGNYPIGKEQKLGDRQIKQQTVSE